MESHPSPSNPETTSDEALPQSSLHWNDQRSEQSGKEATFEQPNETMQARLVGVLMVPAEIFAEITSYLNPLDVLNMSHSNKALRKLLMQRSAVQIWRRALENIPGLPPCPEHLCEPAYAAVIFSKHCSMCGVPVTQQMDPYLYVRLCDPIIYADELENQSLTKLIPKSTLFDNYLRSEVQAVEDAWAEISNNPRQSAARPWVQSRIAYRKARLQHGDKLADYLSSIDEIGKLVERTTNVTAGITDDTWKDLYPQLVPYLEANHERRTSNVAEKRRRRERRLRWLLTDIKKQSVLLKVDKKILTGETSDSRGDPSIDYILDQENPAPSGPEDGGSDAISFDSYVETGYSASDPYVLLRYPFPPLVDALAIPTVAELLEMDIDAGSLETTFDELGGQIEEALSAWGETVNEQLVEILSDNNHTNLENDEPTPPLDLPLDIPAKYLDRLTPQFHLLLRADSVFRIKNRNPCPPPLYYPEMFAIFQDRPESYFELGSLEPKPKRGYPWKTSDIEYYNEGAAAAKALLDELEKPDAAQFELQALGQRFTCGICPDQWPRTWKEIVDHYAEALVHARLATEYINRSGRPIAYKNVHSVNANNGKKKARIILHSLEESNALGAEHPKHLALLMCNSCDQLDIQYLAPRKTMLMHIRAVHALKPKAEHYAKTNSVQKHIRYLPDIIEPVSESCEVGQSDIEKWLVRARKVGPVALWMDRRNVTGKSDPDDKLRLGPALRKAP
ncbi:hypothetical protein FRC07_002252 [Ceratobasidium sp. 392]|nr:hypothetical protein FRC07_002252 [Ceratobasidium sp. 392]